MTSAGASDSPAATALVHHAPVTAAEASAAAARFPGTRILRTPLVRLRAGGNAEIFLKLENLQPIGSFKIRGMWNALAGLDRESVANGVWTLSAGNAAQGVAWSARTLGIPCRVVVPAGASRAKINAIIELGAEIIEVPRDAWFEYAASRSVPGLEGVLVHPFSDRAVMAGNGTIALEILEDLPDVDTILVPWGGGGLCSGIAAVVREIAPAVRVFACEFAPSAPLAASLQAGRPVGVPLVDSFIDGIGAPRVYPEMFELARGLIAGSLITTPDAVAAALRLMVERNAVVPEGAGAVPVAVALTEAAGSGRIACVVSGGNIDRLKLAHLLAAD